MVPGAFEGSVEVEVPINIALIKYWGKRDEELIIPLNNSLSLNIDAVYARTRVRGSCSAVVDVVSINGSSLDLSVKKNRRFQGFFDYARILIRKQLSADAADKDVEYRFEVSSVTNFPVGAGLASSAAGFAAIAFAIGVLFKLPMEEVSILARRGSGSACRSVFGGLVEWQAGNDPSGLDSVAVQRLPTTSWPELRCVIVVLDESEKEVGSSEGMRRTAASCELLQYRASTVVPARIQRLLKAYETHHFDEFARIVMADSNQLHAVCMDSFPPLKYMSDASWQVIRMVNEFNSDRVRAAYTFDAGPNACIFLEDADLPNLLDQLHQHFAIPAEVLSRLASSGDCGLTHTPDIVRKSSFVVKNIIVSTVGGAPRII